MATHTHNHKACVSDALHKAEILCSDTGIRLTPIRKRVLELVWKSHRAIKAYDILEQLDARDGALAPPTVYRALEFLQSHGFVHKVESLNAFIGCGHPLSRHHCQFFICTACGEVDEFCDEGIAERVGKKAKQAGFTPQSQVLEVRGVCASCGKH